MRARLKQEGRATVIDIEFAFFPLFVGDCGGSFDSRALHHVKKPLDFSRGFLRLGRTVIQM